MTRKVSIVIPIFNEESVILELYRRLVLVLTKLRANFEIIFINDGSSDSSLALLMALRKKENRVKYIDFARNFGHQIAVTAGLHFAQGDVVVVMDADLQDPPELIPELLARWKDGFEVVYGERTKRHREGFLKRFTAKVFYRILKRLANVEIPLDSGDFCLMDRCVVDVLNSMPERNRYIRGLRSWIGYRQTSVKYERDGRFAGSPKYTFSKSLGLALDGLISFSRVPLQLSTYLGAFSAVAALLMAFLILYWRLFDHGAPLTGFATIAMAIFFFGAVQLFSIGILGEYIGRLYEEIKGRPPYTIKQAVGFQKKKTTPGSVT